MNVGDYFYRDSDMTGGMGSAVSSHRGSVKQQQKKSIDFQKPTKRLTINEYKRICDDSNQNFMSQKMDYYMQGKTGIADVLIGSK